MKSFIIHAMCIWAGIFRVHSSFVSGPVEGLRCDAETVQLANSAQLNSILKELTATTFFRLVRVDGHGYCPVESLRPAVAADEATCGASVDSFSSFAAPSAVLLPGETSLCSIQTEVSALEIAETVVTAQSAEEMYAQHEFPRDNDCMVEGTFRIRPDYWLDICEGNTFGSPEYVNLKLNPERNTGYNGSAVWAEMHAAAASVDSFEGKILQRLLSGYHMSVSAHVMWSYFPSDQKWLPNYKKAAATFHPERVKDMQFAFVVTARALFKIKDWVYMYPFTTGNVTADMETSSLMHHLLDTSVLSVCGSVLSGFDESHMFASSPTVAPSALEFKKSFRKISRLVNCVTCHRCKLHATVAMHGIGVALKILLTPDGELVTSSLSRDDLVALVNTIETLSEGIQLATALIAPVGPSPTKNKALQVTKSAKLSRHEEDALVTAILDEDPKVMELEKFVFDDEMFFVRHSLISLGVLMPDVVIVGGGLAGLVTALAVADRGGSAVIIEKEARLGGNSAKASSGINRRANEDPNFLSDTLKSQGDAGNATLGTLLVELSSESVSWLEKVGKIDLNAVGQLGGHSLPRTWRPEHGLVGAELVAALARQVKVRSSQIRVILGAKVTKLMEEGVEYEGGVQYARNVVLASGGFGYDSQGLLGVYRPDLVGLPTTLGPQTTGDGIRLGATMGGDLVDMEYVQLHPTGLVDPADLQAHTKVLGAELLRGVGGILLVERPGKQVDRFVNELGTRKDVVDAMMKKKGVFWILLSEESASRASQTTVYKNRGLLRNITNRADLVALLGENIFDVLSLYDEPGDDLFGRTLREGRPLATAHSWLVGQVTPVVHYTMGGLRIDSEGRVLRADGSIVRRNFFAVGEVTGGVHGENRLGGNSLLECVVYGRIVGGEIELREELTPSDLSRIDLKKKIELRKISRQIVEQHATLDDCWTIIGDNVYDLSNYDHPGGPEPIAASCGRNSTDRFLQVHSLGMLEDMDFIPIGIVNFS